MHRDFLELLLLLTSLTHNNPLHIPLKEFGIVEPCNTVLVLTHEEIVAEAK